LCEEEKRIRENICYKENDCLTNGCDCFDDSRYAKIEDEMKIDTNEKQEMTLSDKINKIRSELNLPVKNDTCFIEQKVVGKDDETTYLPFYNRFSRPSSTVSSSRSRSKIAYKSRSKSRSRSPSSSKPHWIPTGANYYFDTHHSRSKLMKNSK